MLGAPFFSWRGQSQLERLCGDYGIDFIRATKRGSNSRLEALLPVPVREGRRVGQSEHACGATPGRPWRCMHRGGLVLRHEEGRIEYLVKQSGGLRTPLVAPFARIEAPWGRERQRPSRGRSSFRCSP